MIRKFNRFSLLSKPSRGEVILNIILGYSTLFCFMLSILIVFMILLVRSSFEVRYALCVFFPIILLSLSSFKAIRMKFIRFNKK
jgi:hypothetical protein